MNAFLLLRLRRSALVASCAWLLAIALACTVEEGDRASTGACPEGETCSSDAPDGLRFAGLALGSVTSERLPATAVWGRQTILVDGLGVSSATVETSSAWFLTLSELDPDQASFVVSAVSPGDTLIRVVDRDGLLLDRVSLRTAAIARVDVARIGDDDAVSIVPGERASLVVRLFDADGERVVDESLEITGEHVETISWDCFDVVVPADWDRGDELIVTATAGDRRAHELLIPIVR
ncbi:MAG: hypothetical protein M3Y87_34170 [Myxococcota bacterium]|nr:hypothetical protein [Myxococcota bacterium]